ncbi:MAG: lambda exonuclease family protein [Vulcanimicrobiaceae bacterium]
MSDLQIFDCEQGSPEWFECRRAIPTASRFKDVLAKGQGLTRRKYLYTLAGEALTGEAAESFSNEHMERGHAMEDEARQQYAFQRDVDPERVGFMRRGGVGCSPDSLIGVDGLLEIKTKLPHLHLEALESDRLPPEHVAQVQGQLWISGRQWCDFVSYWPKLPLFWIRVPRDDSYIATLAVEVEAFNAELAAIVRKYQREAA